MSRSGPRFRPHPASPQLLRGEGVAIRLEQAGGAPLPVLHGVCQAAAETRDRLVDSILHNVQLTLTSDASFASTTIPVVGSELVFSDDVQGDGAISRAYFNIDLEADGIVPVKGKYYVVASFHCHTSDVLEFDCNP